MCVNGSVCEQCKNLTTGSQCQICLSGYYGDPTNGGKCQGEIFLFMFMCTSMSVCVCKSESMALEGVDFTPRKEDFVLICSLFQAYMIFAIRGTQKVYLAEYPDVVFHLKKVDCK